MTIRRIVPLIEAADPAASRAFYVDVLGLEVAMDMGWIGQEYRKLIRRRRTSVCTHLWHSRFTCREKRCGRRRRGTMRAAN